MEKAKMIQEVNAIYLKSGKKVRDCVFDYALNIMDCAALEKVLYFLSRIT